MRPKNGFTQLLVVCLIAGLLVTSVSANPPKPGQAEPVIQAPQTSRPISFEENLDPPPLSERYMPRTSIHQQDSLIEPPDLDRISRDQDS